MEKVLIAEIGDSPNKNCSAPVWNKEHTEVIIIHYDFDELKINHLDNIRLSVLGDTGQPL